MKFCAIIRSKNVDIDKRNIDSIENAAKIVEELLKRHAIAKSDIQIISIERM